MPDCEGSNYVTLDVADLNIHWRRPAPGAGRAPSTAAATPALRTGASSATPCRCPAGPRGGSPPSTIVAAALHRLPGVVVAHGRAHVGCSVAVRAAIAVAAHEVANAAAGAVTRALHEVAGAQETATAENLAAGERRIEERQSGDE